MKSWDKRTKEVAYLLNPAFCGRVIYAAIKTYNEITKRSFPFPLVYLLLPLVLHKEARDTINSKSKLITWVHKYPHYLIDFPERAKSLVPITNEAVELLLQTGVISLTSSGELEKTPTVKSLSKTKNTDDEISACITKAEHVAKWFATAGKPETVYIQLGVRP